MTTHPVRAIRRPRLTTCSRPRGGHRAGRSGFTLIELIVAIVIMVVGVLGLASTAAMVSRMIGGAGQQTVAANVASSRFERLRSVGCSKIVNGDSIVRHMNESWTATKVNSSLWVVTDTITYNAAAGRTPQLIYQSYIRCVP